MAAHAELPSGTVTFLFTDIEGSTRLLHELGERYAEVLGEHRRVVREAFARHSGVEVDTQGDAFFVAFTRASDAVASAQEAQAALANGPVRVRMGLHTGEPIRGEEGYVGIDVHRGARIAGAGHGGQVLLSQATRDLLDAALELRDLGQHRLKDLSEPQRLYQLGSEAFPPLKTLHQTNLPVPATSFLGREYELAEVLRLLRTSRLLTLTGPGGSGKTRLAAQAGAEAAEDFPGGVWWVSLAALRDPAIVLESIAQVLGAKGEPAEHIGDRKLLLLLDNLEQLLASAPELAALLERCSGLRLLVTSREPLRLGAEQEYPVPTFVSEEAVDFFSARARAVTPDFQPDEAVAEVCRRLDNLPLALELAAARVKLLSPEQILARLERALPLLTGGRRDAPERQQTLAATISWSYEMLSEEEKRLFACLSVFAGGCDLGAAEEVCDADLEVLASLVDKSLLRQSDERFWMLETIREFALEQLAESNDVLALRRRHAVYYLALSEQAEPELRGPGSRAWFDRLELDHDNLRGALSWSREAGEAEVGLRLATAVWRFWRTHSHLAEGSRELEALLQLSQTAPAALRARALLGASRLSMDQGDAERSAARAEEALLAAHASGEAREIAATTENLGLMMLGTEATSRAVALLEDGIARFRELGDAVATADALNNLANALLEDGETARAAEVGEEGLALQRGAENALGVAFVLNTLAYVALHEGNLELARDRLEECLVLFQELGDFSGIGASLEGLAHVAGGRGDSRRAVVLWAAGESVRTEAGHRMEWGEAALHEDALSLVRVRLGEETFSAAWAEGAALGPEDAVAFALSSGTNTSRR